MICLIDLQRLFQEISNNNDNSVVTKKFCMPFQNEGFSLENILTGKEDARQIVNYYNESGSLRESHRKSLCYLIISDLEDKKITYRILIFFILFNAI